LRRYFGSENEERRERAEGASRIVSEVRGGVRETISGAPNLLDVWRAWGLGEGRNLAMVRCFISGQVANRTLQECVFEEFLFGGDFGGFEPSEVASSTFIECVFTDCEFHRIELSDCRFRQCVFIRCSFDGSVSMKGVWFEDCHGLEDCLGLHKVRVVGTPPENHHLAEAFADMPLSFVDRYWSWERLRTFGLLPLFGLSLSALVAVPAAMGFLALYNRQIGRWRGWAAEHGDDTFLAPLVQFVERLEPVAVPSLSLLLLLATVLLGVASTIFSFFCPPRIKEFSLERWTDELRQHSVNYIPLSWTKPRRRCIAGFCYWVGGLLAAFVLLWKIVAAGWFILQNTRWPFPFW
jgi:hypothetical protein